MSDLKLNKLSFDANGFMEEFQRGLDVLLDQLSIVVQDLMKHEIMKNGNGSEDMKETAAQQVKELSRKYDGSEVELVVGIDEDSLGGFSSQTFVRTAVVLHGNVVSGPLMAIPNKMAWDKEVTNYRVSDNVKNAYMLPRGMHQYERVNGFGDTHRKMLDNIFNGQINKILGDFERDANKLINSIDYSKYIIGG